jgi:hypothetical protein
LRKVVDELPTHVYLASFSYMPEQVEKTGWGNIGKGEEK